LRKKNSFPNRKWVKYSVLNDALQDFNSFFEEAGDNTGSKTVEDKFFEAEVRRL